MKWERVLVLGLAVSLFLGAAPAAMGAYTSIMHNLMDGTSDAAFDGTTFTISQAVAPGVTLNDSPTVGGTITAGSVTITTQYVDYNTTFPDKAYFNNGSYSLAFTHNGNSYTFGGPIPAMTIEEDSSGFYTILNGAAHVNINEPIDLPAASGPHDGVWPDGGGLSTIDSITITLGVNLGGFDWDNETFNGNTQSQYTIFPEQHPIPEPAALALLGLGSLIWVRRRRT